MSTLCEDTEPANPMYGPKTIYQLVSKIIYVHINSYYCDFQNAVTPLVHGTQDIMFVKIIHDSNDIVKYNSSS